MPLRARFHPPPFKPCVRFSRTRLTDGVHECSMRGFGYRTVPRSRCRPSPPEPIPRPRPRLSCSKIPAPALHHEVTKPQVNVGVELVELPGRIPRSEVVSTAAQHRVQTLDDFSHVFHSSARFAASPSPTSTSTSSLRSPDSSASCASSTAVTSSPWSSSITSPSALTAIPVRHSAAAETSTPPGYDSAC
jgi:hypothetical protein